MVRHAVLAHLWPADDPAVVNLQTRVTREVGQPSGVNLGRGYVARQFAAAAESKPNTTGRERAQGIAVTLFEKERDHARHLLFRAVNPCCIPAK
ncbi:hypothetical protein ACIRO1_41045 [Streptomyces sp. NPDC102381]|uniref:hypothetical protein n=1 Tax=Streptomyces sp. NPDC102381 TaxID=3366164 RepID=UPI00381C9F29